MPKDGKLKENYSKIKPTSRQLKIQKRRNAEHVELKSMCEILRK